MDRCVVDEHVELVQPLCVDRALVGDVEPDRVQIAGHRGRVAGAREHVVASRQELARDLEPEAAVGAGDERGRHGPIVHFERRAPLTAARLPKCTPGSRAS